MLKSKAQEETTEFERIREDRHVAKVWSKIEDSLPSSFEIFESSIREGVSEDGLDQLKAHFGAASTARTSSTSASADLRREFSSAVDDVQKMQDKYKKIFDDDVLEEYEEDDPRGFKSAFAKDCPIIARTLRSRRRELLDWQQAFKRTKAQELLDVSSNLLEFAEEYVEAIPSGEYEAYDTITQIGLEGSEEESMTIPGLIGMGIKSAILHHLSPEYFPLRGRRDLYALYFLSGRGDFGLSSATSEFIMVNDDHELRGSKNYRMDQNYWYPYGLFTLYSLRIYRALKARCRDRGAPFDDKYRYVYVHRFYEAICDHHQDHIRTMLGGDEDLIGH